MYIYGLLDFYQQKEKIRKGYKKMSRYEKHLYKMYIYSLCFETTYVKDLMWEYINGYRESLADLSKEYRLRKNKMEKIRKDEM